MKIKYNGHSCFTVYGKEFSLCIDPYRDIGLTPKDCRADYYFCSHTHYDHYNWEITKAKPFTGGKTVKTFHDQKRGALRGDNMALVVEIEGVTIAHLGDLGEEKNSRLASELKQVDVLMIPVGGNYTVDFRQAMWYVDNIKPKIVIPMHYHIEGSTVDIDDIDRFLSINTYLYKKRGELEVSKESLPEQTEVIELIAEVI